MRTSCIVWTSWLIKLLVVDGPGLLKCVRFRSFVLLVVAGKLFSEKGNITVVVICVNMIPQQNVCRCFLTLGYEPWLELGPGLSQPEALQKAQAWIRSSLSRSKPGHSRGFQAKLGLHITMGDYTELIWMCT